MMYLGDFKAGATVHFKWSTNAADGSAITRATNGTVSVYHSDNTTQTTNGVTDTEDFDSVTGIHHCKIDTSADGTFYTAGREFQVVLSGATIDSKSVASVLAHFSIERSDNAVVMLANATYGLSAIKVLVDDLETRLTATRAGYLDNLSGGPMATAATVSTLSIYVDTEVAAILAAVDTEVAAIKAKTDNLPSDPADDSDIDAQLAAIAAYIDTEVAAILAAVDTEVAAIKAKTDNLPASPAAVGSAMTLAADTVNASALAAYAVTEIATAVNAEVVDALATDTYGEPSGVPAATSSLKDKIGFIFAALRNKHQTTATTDVIRNDADSAAIGTASLTEDGTTFTRGEYA